MESTDVHGLGVSILFAYFEGDSGMQLLFGCTKDTNSSLDSIKGCPIVKLVKQMTTFRPEERISLSNVITILENMPPEENRKSVEDFGLRYKTKYYSVKNTLNQSFTTTSLNLENPDTLSKTINFKNISSDIHDQGKTYFCWAISIATILKSELKRLVMRLRFTEKIIKDDEMNEILKLVMKLNDNDNLLKELAYLVIPRKPKFTKSTEETDLSYQTSTVIGAMEKICCESVIWPAGWKRLPSVVKITDQLPGKSTI